MTAKKAPTAPPENPVTQLLSGELGEALRGLSADQVRKYAAEAFEPLADTGPLRGEASGEVVLELPDLVVRFRVPTFGEFQVLSEAPAGDADTTLEWWRLAAAGDPERDLKPLGDHPLPDAADLPMWLANPTYARQALNHWMLRPTQAPGT